MTNLAQQIDLPEQTPRPVGAPVVASSPLPFLKSVKVQVSVRVGQATLSVDELLAARPGTTLTLDRLVDQAIDVLVDEHVIARGTLVAVGEHFGVRLTEAAQFAPAGTHG
jgi:flagellar motor switch protein FliN